MLTLFYTPGTSSFAPHIALHEVGASFEAVPLSLSKGELKTPEYKSINPTGKVPTLLVDGRPLTEVAAILYYIAKRFPDARLLPDDTDVESQAQVLSWMSFVASGIHPIWSKGLDIALPQYDIADQKLGEREWIVDEYSIADIHLFRVYWRLLSKYQLPPDRLPNLQRHHDQMIQRPAVVKTLEVEASVGYELP